MARPRRIEGPERQAGRQSGDSHRNADLKARSLGAGLPNLQSAPYAIFQAVEGCVEAH
jgi:hypothetical protein